MSDAILAEALLRIEHKVDVILRSLVGTTSIQPLHFVGQVCPVCLMTVDYTVDAVQQVVVRRCGCKTGKIPSSIQLIPDGVTNNVNTNPERPPERATDGDQAQNSPRRKAR